MARNPFPFAPFIEIFSGTECGDPDALRDEWHYRIGGCNGIGCCASAEDAAEAAERELFREHGDLVEKCVHTFLDEGKSDLALQLVERRGFHAGIAQERERIGTAIAAVTDTLNQAVGRRPGFGSHR